MTLTLDLSAEQEAVLREQAAKEGSDEREIALHLLYEALKKSEPTPKARPFHETATPEEWVKAWHEWTHSHENQSAVLLDDSREMIYED